jgi:hypothetical protein
VNLLSTPVPVAPVPAESRTVASEPVPHEPASAAERATRAERRAAIGSRFLDALEGIVRRHRSLAPAEHPDLHAELIAAEVAHHLALVRAELARAPHLRGGD